MKRKLLQVALITGLLASGSAIAASPSAKALSITCAGCHGFNGVSVGPASPSLAGLPHEYFVDAMVAYQDGTRPATVMDRIAKGYSAEEIKLMADYFSAMDFVPAKQDFDKKQVAAGQRIVERRRSCGTCHEENGTLGIEDMPQIAGQWTPYVRYSMEDFRHHGRPMSDDKTKQIERLSDSDIDAVAAFLASQQDPKLFKHKD